MAGKTAKSEKTEKTGKTGKTGKIVRIRLVRSTIGCLPVQRRTVTALGLRRRGAVVEKAATPAVLGMVRAVAHLIEVEEKG